MLLRLARRGIIETFTKRQTRREAGAQSPRASPGFGRRPGCRRRRCVIKVLRPPGVSAVAIIDALWGALEAAIEARTGQKAL